MAFDAGVGIDLARDGRQGPRTVERFEALAAEIDVSAVNDTVAAHARQLAALAHWAEICASFSQAAEFEEQRRKILDLIPKLRQVCRADLGLVAAELPGSHHERDQAQGSEQTA